MSKSDAITLPATAARGPRRVRSIRRGTHSNDRPKPWCRTGRGRRARRRLVGQCSVEADQFAWGAGGTALPMDLISMAIVTRPLVRIILPVRP